jgi:SMI1 / KNR4 family (SUKH-1)
MCIKQQTFDCFGRLYNKIIIGGVDVESKVQKALHVLKNRIEKGQVHTQREDGEELEVTFFWHPPISTQEINEFSKKTGWIVPDGFRDFLLFSNGATLFFYEPGFSGLRLYGLEEIIDYFNEYDHLYKHAYDKNWYMIGERDGEYFFIDSERVKEGQTDYIVWVQVGDIQVLPLDFDTWLDRFIVCQGTPYWRWGE